MNTKNLTDNRLIFVVGNSRSGTTMLGRILGNHERIFTFHEIHFFEELTSVENLDVPVSSSKANLLFANLISIQREGYLNQRVPEKYLRESVKTLSETEGKNELMPVSIFRKYLNYETRKNGKQIPCDQTPRNLFFLQEILEHFPGAKVINMVRDPRDVLLSQKKKWKRRFLGAKNIPLMEAFRSWANYHPFIISKLWNASLNKIGEFDNHQHVTTIYFEELLSDPVTVVKKVCTFLDIGFRPEMLEIPQIGSSSQEDDSETRGIRKDRASSWKKGGLTDTELYFCQHICAGQIKNHGYTQETVHYRRYKVLLSYLVLPFKLGISFLLNIRRYRNLIDALRRRFA